MISLLQLQYFLAMAEEGHLTRTAEKLYVSQSTLSSMISKLENELGVELFDRKNNRMVLNEYGKEYRKNVVAALGALNTGARNVKRMAAERSNRLSVAMTNAQVWQEALWEFRSLHPEFRLQILSDKMEQYSRLLEEGELDFIIAGEEDIDSRQCEATLLAKNRLCLCVPHGHPLEKRTGVFLKEIENEPYIELSPDLPYRQFCDRLYQKLDVHMNTVIECGYNMRSRLVQEGYGLAITTNGPSTRRMFSEVSFIAVEDEAAVRVINLLWLKGRRFTPSMQAFYDYMLARQLKNGSLGPIEQERKTVRQ